eukprot:5210196-Pyramimonas_sp.AAC.1
MDGAADVDPEVGPDAGEAGGVAAAPAIALPALAVLGAPDAGAFLRPVHWRGFTVRYDHWSHSSGILRCYATCRNPTHRKCFRYMQENRLPTRREVIAHLFGWAEL